jgi:hypothetical protein
MSQLPTIPHPSSLRSQHKHDGRRSFVASPLLPIQGVGPPPKELPSYYFLRQVGLPRRSDGRRTRFQSNSAPPPASSLDLADDDDPPWLLEAWCQGVEIWEPYVAGPVTIAVVVAESDECQCWCLAAVSNYFAPFLALALACDASARTTHGICARPPLLAQKS